MIDSLGHFLSFKRCDAFINFESIVRVFASQDISSAAAAFSLVIIHIIFALGQCWLIIQ